MSDTNDSTIPAEEISEAESYKNKANEFFKSNTRKIKVN